MDEIKYNCEICDGTKDLIKIDYHNIRVCKNCLEKSKGCDNCLNQDISDESENPICKKCCDFSHFEKFPNFRRNKNA